MLSTEVQDSHAWYLATAQALREGRLHDVDLLAVAEELEEIGNEKKRALESYLTNLLMHLLKWRFQPNRRSSSWISSIREARNQLQSLLEFNPSLKPYYLSVFPKCYTKAHKDARLETGLSLDTFPPTCPWSTDEILEEDFYLKEFADFWEQHWNRSATVNCGKSTQNSVKLVARQEC